MVESFKAEETHKNSSADPEQAQPSFSLKEETKSQPKEDLKSELKEKTTESKPALVAKPAAAKL